MSRVGFETTIPVFERAKKVQASDRAATVIGILFKCMAFIINIRFTLTIKTKLNSVALVRKRNIPTERPPLSEK
jgi:hypothetical protein